MEDSKRRLGVDVVCILTITYRGKTKLEKMGSPTNDIVMVF